ncbi:hypothetical protein SBBP1_530011 [Burkholderiales bacterium]|nr:hypothetical protein SBBP1_530011 [Burkholderiales bacterium]
MITRHAHQIFLMTHLLKLFLRRTNISAADNTTRMQPWSDRLKLWQWLILVKRRSDPQSGRRLLVVKCPDLSPSCHKGGTDENYR